MRKWKTNLVFCIAFLATQGAWCAPFLAYDARSMAMGGAGVAVGTGANASLLNPALLGIRAPQEQFNLEFPAVTALVSDRGNFRGAWDDYDRNKYDQRLSSSVDAFLIEADTQYKSGLYDYAKLSVLRDKVVVDGRTMLNVLEHASNHWIGAQGNAAMVLGVPDPKYGVSLFWNTWAVGGALFEITPQDSVLLNDLLNTAQSINDSNAITLVEALKITDPTDKLFSNVRARMSQVTEFGFSYARQLQLFAGDVAIGVSPKVLDVATYDAKYIVRELKTIEWQPQSWKKKSVGANVDFGAVARFTHNYHVGLVVKNALTQHYETILANSIAITPQWRFGIGYVGEIWTWTADVDVVANSPSSFEGRSQYLGGGFERRIFSWLKLRAGARHDFESRSNLYSAGFGLALWALHVEAALAGSENELGASLQLGLRF